MTQTPTPNADAVLHRFDAIAREAMVQLSRWKGERVQWREQFAELEHALQRAPAQDLEVLATPLRAAIRRAIGSVDGILERGTRGAPT